MADVQIRLGGAADLPDVVRISDEQFGAGYLTGETFADRAFVLIASAEGLTVGFAIGLFRTPEEVASLLRTPTPVGGVRATGVIKTVAVASDMQGVGVGSDLVSVCMLEFRSRRVTDVFSVAWKQGETVNIGGVLRRHGFTPFAEVPRFWAEDSIRENYLCAECGNPPCECAALLFRAHLPWAAAG